MVWTVRHGSFAILLIAFALVGSVNSPLRAEDDPMRGRLPDGRAFRTDAEGVQLVDYIAELELSVEELTRKVRGLESEVADKQKSLNRCSTTGSADDSIEERDLLGSKTRTGRQAYGVPERYMVPTSDQVACPEPPPCPQMPQVAANAASSNSEEIRALQHDVERLHYELEKERRAHQQDTAALRSVVDNQSRIIESRTGELTMLQAKLEEVPPPAPQIPATVTQDIQIIEQPAPKPEIADRAQLKRPTTELPVVAALSKPVVAKANKPSPATVQTVSPAQRRAVQTVRMSVRSELNKVKSLARSRDTQFKEYNRTTKQLKVSPGPLVSSRKVALNAVAGRIDNAMTFRELSALQKDLQEIKDNVQKDLTLINRLKRAG